MRALGILFVWSLALGLFFGLAAFAQTGTLTYYACTIDINAYKWVQYCGVGVPAGKTFDAAFPCNTDPNAMARTVCNINTPQGVTSVPYDPPVQVGFHLGGRCGVGVFRITCNPASGTQVAYDTGRQGAIRLPCIGGGPIPAGGVALAVCQRQNPPLNTYTYFLTWDQGGGKCGSSVVRAICYASNSGQR